MKPEPTPTTDSERKVLEDIARYGWHVIHIMADARGPGWSFSIGLFRTFGHPELVVFGLPSDRTQTIINDLGERIRAGARFRHGFQDSTVLVNYPVQFVTVPASAYRDHLGYAVWYYRHDPFPVLQVVWPDRSASFPWQSDFEPSLKTLQPVLGATT